MAKLFLQTGMVDVNSTAWMVDSPLLFAANNGHEAVVKLLLQTGAVDVNSTNWIGESPLSLAACRGHEAVIKLLLQTGRVDDSKGKMPEWWTTKFGRDYREAVAKSLQPNSQFPSGLVEMTKFLRL